MSDKIRLLFVDDEDEFLGYMTKRLVKRDIEVAAFNDPLEALDRTRGQTFDVALLDLKMPDMDGETLLQRLKDRDPHVEVLILTGHGTIQSAFQASRSGAYEYLLKPCDFDELVTAISNAYAKRIKIVAAEKTERVNELLARAQGMSPLALLEALKRIEDET